MLVITLHAAEGHRIDHRYHSIKGPEVSPFFFRSFAFALNHHVLIEMQCPILFEPEFLTYIASG